MRLFLKEVFVFHLPYSNKIYTTKKERERVKREKKITFNFCMIFLEEFFKNK